MVSTCVVFEVVDLGEALVVQVKHVVEVGSGVVLLEITLCQLLQELLRDDTVVLGVRPELHIRFIIRTEF